MYVFSFTAYNKIMQLKDKMAFTYEERLPVEVAHKYVCISHVPGFWDRVIVGQHITKSAAAMFAADPIMPKLFDVNMAGDVSFHWCCFVLKKHIFLCAWFFSTKKKKAQFICLSDSPRTRKIINDNFRIMLHYLKEWFSSHYGSSTRDMKVCFNNVACVDYDMDDLLLKFIKRYGVKNDYSVEKTPRNGPKTKLSFSSTQATKLMKPPTRDESQPDVFLSEEFHNYLASLHSDVIYTMGTEGVGGYD